MGKRKVQGARCHWCEKVKPIKAGNFQPGLRIKGTVPFLCNACETELTKSLVACPHCNRSHWTDRIAGSFELCNDCKEKLPKS